MKRSKPDAYVDPYGRLLFPCDDKGRLEGPLPIISILISKNSASIVIQNSSSVEPHKVEFDESRRRFMCRSIFMVNMDDAKATLTAGVEDGLVQVNPFVLEKVTAIVFDGKNRQVILEKQPGEFPSLPGIPVPVFPLCKRVGLHKILESSNGFLSFQLTPYSPEPSNEPRYLLTSRFPVKTGDSYDLLFVGHHNGDVSFPPKSQVIKTLFEIPPEEEFVVTIEKERGLLKLPLKIVSENEDLSGRVIYRITVTKTPELMMILINPYTRRNVPFLDVAVGKLSGSFAKMNS